MIDIAPLLEILNTQKTEDRVYLPAGWEITVPSVNNHHEKVLSARYLLLWCGLSEWAKPRRYLVIGAFQGTTESDAIKATGWHPDRIVMCDIDSKDYGEGVNLAHAYRNLVEQKAGGYRGELVIVREDSHKSLAVWDLGPYDVIYVDGDHTEEGCWNDLCNAERFVRKGGGMVWLHDFEDPRVRGGYDRWNTGLTRSPVVVTVLKHEQLLYGMAIIQF